MQKSLFTTIYWAAAHGLLQKEPGWIAILGTAPGCCILRWYTTD